MDGRGGILVVQAATAPPPGVRSLRRVSWILEVMVWRCRARLPDVLGSFLKFLTTALVLVASQALSSPRDRALIRELNETVLALTFLESGSVARAESCEKVGTPSCVWTLCQEHFRVSTL